MANLTENPNYEAGIYQLEVTDPVVGGPNGISNLQAQQLANRTGYLFDKLQNAGLTGKPRQISGDLNAVIAPGFYLVRSGATNKPVNKFGHLFVSGDAAAPDQNNQSVSACQLYIVNNTEVAEMYFRVSLALVGFSAWVKVATSQDLTNSLGQFTGMVSAFGGTSAPFGWFECNGAAVSRTTYAALFARIGTTHGSGNGTTTFNLPDLRGEFVRGWDHGRGIDTDRVAGSAQAGEIAGHRHEYNQSVVENPPVLVNTVAGGQFAVPNGNVNQQSGLTGGVETRPRNVALIHCIKY